MQYVSSNIDAVALESEHHHVRDGATVKSFHSQNQWLRAD
jgi:hypothetical protein